jgi:hypothetical protein
LKLKDTNLKGSITVPLGIKMENNDDGPQHYNRRPGMKSKTTNQDPRDYVDTKAKKKNSLM